MSKLPPLKSREVIRALQKAGLLNIDNEADTKYSRKGILELPYRFTRETSRRVLSAASLNKQN